MNKIDLLNTTIGGAGLLPFADRLESRLTPLGRLNLLGVALRSAPEREAIYLCDAFLASHSIGHPVPAFLNIYDDAKWHAANATPTEQKAYCLAHYQAMSATDQASFQAHIGNNRKAA